MHREWLLGQWLLGQRDAEAQDPAGAEHLARGASATSAFSRDNCWFHSLVVMTSPLHGEGPEFNPRWNHVLFFAHAAT